MVVLAVLLLAEVQVGHGEELLETEALRARRLGQELLEQLDRLRRASVAQELDGERGPEALADRRQAARLLEHVVAVGIALQGELGQESGHHPVRGRKRVALERRASSADRLALDPGRECSESGALCEDHDPGIELPRDPAATFPCHASRAMGLPPDGADALVSAAPARVRTTMQPVHGPTSVRGARAASARGSSARRRGRPP